MDKNNTPGQRLKMLRGKIPQDVVAAEVGVTKSALSNYENDIRVPRPETMSKLAHYFHHTVDEIFF